MRSDVMVFKAAKTKWNGWGDCNIPAMPIK